MGTKWCKERVSVGPAVASLGMDQLDCADDDNEPVETDETIAICIGSWPIELACLGLHLDAVSFFGQLL